MKKIAMFDQIAQSGFAGLDGAIAVCFGKPLSVEKEGMIGLPFGTVVIDGKAWDWLLKDGHYVFIIAE